MVPPASSHGDTVQVPMHQEVARVHTAPKSSPGGLFWLGRELVKYMALQRAVGYSPVLLQDSNHRIFITAACSCLTPAHG